MAQEIPSIICPSCKGEGGHEGQCFRCDGAGFRLVEGNKVSCRICQGTGKCVHRCRLCNGKGIIRSGDEINLRNENEYLRCQFCYLNVKRDKSRTTITVKGSTAEEVERVARSMMLEMRLQEIPPHSEASNDNLAKNVLAVKGAVRLFFSYAHEDETFLRKLQKHLKPLYREELIQEWNDRDINAGTEWKKEIDDHLNTAHIILLLISPDFMHSDYCYSIEMKRALERHEKGEAQVIPIILRPVLWKLTSIRKLLVLPTDGKPITDPSWSTQDRAFHNVAKAIQKVLEQLIEKPSLVIPPTQGEVSNKAINNVEPENYFCYCSKCQNKTKMKEARQTTTKSGKIAMKGMCTVCGTNVCLILSAKNKK